MSRYVAALSVLLVACGGVEPAGEPTDAPTDDAPTEVASTDAAPTEAACAAVPFLNEQSGTYTVNDGGEHHVKHHFSMPEGTRNLQVIGQWDEADWGMDLAIGIGGCPHRGKTMATTAGSGGELKIELAAAELEGAPEAFVAGDKWFAHFGLDMEEPPADGSTSGYAFEVLACK